MRLINGNENRTRALQISWMRRISVDAVSEGGAAVRVGIGVFRRNFVGKSFSTSDAVVESWMFIFLQD